jgi:LacI family transcriptional regulator
VSTIKHVAAHAGVSPSTVSRVLNAHANVDAHLARRVRDAIKQLEYQPSPTARALRRRRSHVWSLIISDIRNGFFGEVARGVEDAAQDSDLAVVLCNTDDDLARERAYVDLAIAERVAGVILSPASAAETSVARLAEAGVPVVLIDRAIEGGDVDLVAIDNRRAAHGAVRHLIDEGFERIACIGGPASASTARERIDGYREALAEAGRATDPQLVVNETFKPEGGTRAAAALLALPERPDALFICNGPQCAGAIPVIRSLGLSVPGDLGIVCFDDEVWTALTSPDITAVAQPAYEIGTEAAAILRRRLLDAGGAPRRILLTTELRVRSSSRRLTNAADGT